MFTRVCLSLALLVAMPARSQVPIAEGPVARTDDQMRTPPPVSGTAYPTEIIAESQSNYLRGGLIVTTAYTDNVLGDSGSQFGSAVYSILPVIAIDKTTSRLRFILAYSPGFTFYQKASTLDQTDQHVALSSQYRLSPHVTAALYETLRKASSVFNQSDLLPDGGVSGSPQPPTAAIIPPVGGSLTNTAVAELTYQFRRNSMIGTDGLFTNLSYSSNPTVKFNLQDSSSSGGSAFYSRRLSRNDYIGAVYQYLNILTSPVNVQTNTVYLFYTIYLKPTFSISFSGGPQHFDVSQRPLTPYASWTPGLTASSGWQGRHTNFAIGYTRAITGGGGLVGAFESNSANAYGRWRFGRNWSTGLVSSYANNKSVTPPSFSSTGGGHTLYGIVSVQRQLREHLEMELGYIRAHQTYSGIPAISTAPNTNRGFISFSYTFTRPLGGG